MKYKPVIIEAVYPDGTVMVRAALKDENSACKGEDPKWSRERLIDYANTVAARWNETYGWHPAVFRVVS